MTGRWGSFVALGDSFTEGLDDPRGDGTYRGWADLVAERLAADVGDVGGGAPFRYANLAVRGRLLGGVIAQQVPVAVHMRPDLISFAAGGNDMLRRRFDMAALSARYEAAVERLVATGATVLIFAWADLTGQLPGGRYIQPRIGAMLDLVRRVAATHGAALVDLWSDDGFRDRRMWSLDRLHLNPAGHRRVAAHVLDALGVPVDPAWRSSLAPPPPVAWTASRRADLVWARTHLAPWVGRRLTGRSSGDVVRAKRPALDVLSHRT